jgi:hypothetical protein
MYKVTYVYTIPEDQPIEFFTPSDEAIEYATKNYESHILVNDKQFSDDSRTLTQVLVFDEKENFLRYSSDSFLNQNNFLPKKFYNEQRGITMSVSFENLEASF